MTDRAASIVVVGDGPAGCAAAITAVRLGARVDWIGRGRSVDAPEYVSANAMRLLDHVFPRDRIQWLDAARDERGGRAVLRRSLDDALRRAAIAAGARYSCRPVQPLDPSPSPSPSQSQSQSPSQSQSGSGSPSPGALGGVRGFETSLAADVVIDATGARSWLRRRGHLEQRIDSRPFWLSRGFAERASTGFDDRNPRATTPTEWLADEYGWRWMRKTSSAWIWTALTRRKDHEPPWPADMQCIGRVWRDCRQWRCLVAPAGPGYFACGDAAAYLDPATGDGVEFAIDSGARAAVMAVRSARDPRQCAVAAAVYTDWVRQRYETRKALLESLTPTESPASGPAPHRDAKGDAMRRVSQ